MELELDWKVVPGGPPDAVRPPVSTKDSLVISLRDLGRVDIPYMASVAETEAGEVIEALRGSIYQDPETKRWLTAEEYLSGKLDRKLAAALAAEHEQPGRFAGNVAAIKRAMPPKIEAGDIYVTLGSPWVPTEMIEEFIAHLADMGRVNCRVKHDPKTATWTIANKRAASKKAQCRLVWGTPRCDAMKILEDSLNGKSVRVYDEVDDRRTKSGKRQQVNRAETLAAIEKQSRLIGEFETWAWADHSRKETLERLFNEAFGYNVVPHYDGGFLDLPGLAAGQSLRDYQKDAVARILMTPNTLLAHDVGAGKTYVMVAAGMEKRRLGLSRKNLYVVPNNVLGQWAKVFGAMYPDADVLVIPPGGFKSAKRQALLEELRDGDHDAIIMPQSSFDRLPLSSALEVDEISARLRQLKEAYDDPKRATTSVKSEYASLLKKLNGLLAEGIGGKDAGICFDELGVTGLFVDEAHTYKNIPVRTGGVRILGVSSPGSSKCKHMLRAVRCVQRSNGGGGVVFATGTPITNSVADCFVMQSYLQKGALSIAGLDEFPAWAGAFAERQTEFEVDVDTSSYRMATRLSRFNNLPELEAMLASFADFHHVEPGDGKPSLEGYEDVVVPCPAGLKEYLGDIALRADQVRSGHPRKRGDEVDNLLWITTDGRMAALDPRLVGVEGVDARATKVHACAERVAEVYYGPAAEGCAQLVMCDISTPKDEFNVYDELKGMLTCEFGLPDEEIAFVHSAASDAARERLFSAVRSGDIRVLMGSTPKLGIGVNVQERLAALHHLDVPWRPADMVQREGRIIREGNTCPEVRIFHYVTEGSFDAYSWQLLQTKASFIHRLLSGCYGDRSLTGDVGEMVLNCGEVKALAIGDPTLRERFEVDNELNRLMVLWRKTAASKSEQRAEMEKLRRRLDAIAKRIPDVRRDIARYKVAAIPQTRQARRKLRHAIYTAISKNAWVPTERHAKAADGTQHCLYRSFAIMLPEWMDPTKPYLWLVGSSRYRVELGDNNEQGVMARMENVLNGLPELLRSMEAERHELSRQLMALKWEIADDHDDLRERIERLRSRRDEIDLELEEKHG